MEILSALTMAVNTWERIANSLMSFAIFGTIPIAFIVFLIFFIKAVWDVKKKGAGKTKAVVFGCISGYFLLGVIAEVAFMLLLASAVAHM